MKKILSSLWFNEMGRVGCIGIVTVENELGERKAYVGIGSGFDEAADARHIAEYGGKLTLDDAKAIVARLQQPEVSA